MISSTGLVKRQASFSIRSNGKKFTLNERLLKGWKTQKGYLVVNIVYIDNINKTRPIHRLVAEAFIENTNNLDTVNHKDLNKNNNCVSNLEWLSNKENNQHSFLIGDRVSKMARGEKSYLNKFKENTILEIAELIKNKVSYKQIKEKTGMSFAGISAIKNGKMWKHLNLKFD